MKIEFENDKVIVYLYKYHLTFDDIDKLNNEVKSIFVKLIKIYNLKLDGYLKVIVYENEFYGCVLEIENLLSDYEFSSIDLKLVIEDKCDFYFKTSDYSIVEKYDKLYYFDDYFYVNLKEIDDLIEIIEHGSIIYNLETFQCKILSRENH